MKRNNAALVHALASITNVKLTRTQRHWLQRAADLKRGEYLTWGTRGNSGGAIYRMLDRLKATGLLKGPPWTITTAGRAVLSQPTR